MVEEGKAKEFQIKGERVHKIGGRLRVRNGRIVEPDLWWGEMRDESQ